MLTGAAGNIAYTLIPIIGSGRFNNSGFAFGEDTYINFYLYDLPSKLGKLQAFALEIQDCCFSNVLSVNCNVEARSIEEVSI